MEALNQIPLTLESVEDFKQRGDALEELLAYKKNVKLFIAQVQQEISQLMVKHDNEIRSLTKELKMLKQQNRLLKEQGRPRVNVYDVENMECISPIKKARSHSIALQPHSNFLMGESGTLNLFSQSPPRSQHLQRNRPGALCLINKNSKEFPIQIIDPETSRNEVSRSRFEVQTKKKKRRRQQVLQYLEAGSINLDLNTSKILTLLGKLKPEQRQQDEEQQIVETKQREKDQELNASLGAICDSLDHSFVSRRSRAKLGSKVAEAAQQEEKKKIKEEEQQLKRKHMKVKSVLKNMRDNIQTSPSKVEVVKGSKLLKTGEQGKFSGKGSKVLINPVPVQAQGGERQNRSISPTKSRTGESILKKKNSILSKSITGISAISFHQD